MKAYKMYGAKAPYIHNLALINLKLQQFHTPIAAAKDMRHYLLATWVWILGFGDKKKIFQSTWKEPSPHC